jgi:transposase
MLIETPDQWTELDVDAFPLPPTFPIVLPVCRQLRLAAIVDACCPMKWCSHVTHGQVVEFVVLHLLQSPHRQPLYQLESWSDEHNIHGIYGCPAEAFNDDRVGHTLDAIEAHIAEIEARVVTEALRGYRVDARQIHWDLTHVTFSGTHEGSEIVGKGYGDGAIHEKQVQVSLHVTGEGGIPVRHQTLAGNAHQAPLAADMLQDLQQRLPRSDLLVVSDRAGISYENILVYRRGKAHFVASLALQAPQEAALAAAPLEAFIPLEYRSHSAPHEQYSCYQTTLRLNPQERHAPIWVPTLFVHNTGKQRRDAQDRQKRIDKALTRVGEIRGHLNQRRYAKADYAREQLAKAVPPAVQAIVQYELTGGDHELSLHFWIDEAARAAAGASDGRYVLVYELPGASPEEIFLIHKRQSGIEARFRNLNSDLSVHPLWLQHDHRIRALLLIFVLALIVYTLLQLCADRVGLEGPHYPKMTTRQMLFTFGHVRLKQVTIRGSPILYELVTSPAQRAILDALAFPDPTIYLIHRPPTRG